MPQIQKFFFEIARESFQIRPDSIVAFIIATTTLGHLTGQETVLFQDKTSASGLQIGTDAACWADFDNDGWVDLCASGGVWKNQQGKMFTRIADVPTSVAADFDNDGFIDLFSWAALKLYRNNAGKEFTEVKLPELPKSSSRGACWGDFNGDGFVDIYVGGYEEWNAGITWPFMILINKAGKGFRLERSESNYRARGVTAADFDNDGDIDIYASNYRLQPNLLWLNDGAGQFADAAGKYGVVATSEGFGGGHSIGSCWGDFNNDGFIDLFAGNFAHVDGRGDQPKSRFLKNLGPDQDYQFADLGPSGVHYQESYATPSAGDYDNDGNLDLFFTTVYGVASFGRKNNPVLFRNAGNFVVSDVTVAAQLQDLPPTYQAAWADFDNDGDLDLASAGKLFENQGSPNNWLKVRLQGDGKSVNRSAIGAQVRIQIGEKTLTRQVEAGTGEGNQNELTLHFGLAANKDPLQVEIAWPNRQHQTITGVMVNSLLTVNFAPSTAASESTP